MTGLKSLIERFGVGRAGIAAVLLLGAWVRLLGIYSRPIWYDEAYAILQSAAGFKAILQGILGRDPSGLTADQHPPGYFVTLWGWIELWGDSVVSARLLSILIGVATIWLVYLLGREIVGAAHAWVPALVVAIDPFHIHYSTEIRMYALMAGMLVLATLALWKMTRGVSGAWWVVFGVSAAMAQYSQHLAGFFLAPLAMIPVFRRDWVTVRKVACGTGLALLLYAPWMMNLPGQIASTAEYWVPRPEVNRFLTFLVATHSGLPALGMYAAIGLAGGLILLTLGLVVTVRDGRREHREDARPSGVWLLYLALVPPVLLWLVSQVWPVYIERALLASVVCFAVWIGWALGSKAVRRFERAILIFVLLVGAYIGIQTHLTYQGFPYANYDEIGEMIAGEIKQSEVVVHSNKLTFVPMFYYHSSALDQRFVADLEGSGSDTLRIPTQEVLGFRESGSIEEAVGDAEGFWLVIFKQAIEEARASGGETHPHLEWAQKYYYLRTCSAWDDILVCYYPFRQSQ